MYFQKVKVNLESPLELRSNNKFSCLTTHQDEEKLEEEIARLPAMSSSTETDNECLDFGDVVVGFFVVQLMAQLDREWHDEYYRNVVAGLFVFQLMALHENEVLFGALDEKQGDEDEEDIELHLPSLTGGGDQEESAKVEERGDEDEEDIELHLPSLAGGGDQEESAKVEERGDEDEEDIELHLPSLAGGGDQEESAKVEERGDEEEEDIQFHLPSPSGEEDQSAKVEEQGDEDGEDIEFHLPSLAGGGDQEESEEGMSPPKKRRKRGKGPLNQITRRRKTSKSTEEVTESEESLVSSSLDNAVSPKMTDKKAAWRNSPKGKSSIAESNKKYHLKNKSIEPRRQASMKYEATDKARSTRSRYEANKGAETRARYEASDDGKETRKRYKSSQGRIESQASYECSWKGLQTRIRYNSSQGASAIRDTSRYGLSFKQRTVLYKKQVKNAIKHLIARTAETKQNAETEPDTKNEPPHEGAADLSGEESVNPEPGAEKFPTNKNAMATIRSHKVGHLCQLD